LERSPQQIPIEDEEALREVYKKDYKPTSTTEITTMEEQEEDWFDQNMNNKLPSKHVRDEYKEYADGDPRYC
jgi:hypothetical protein